MKKVIRLLVLFCVVNGYSQLFVGSNSYVYVGDQFLYAKQNVELEEDVIAPIDNGRLFLRREGQFLQGTTGISTNSGRGSLSVYQEGTSNNFGYNYWCSPVGNPIASPTHGNFGIGLLNQPTSVTQSNPATLLPYSNLNSVSSPLSITARWIYKFTPIVNNASVLADWVYVGGNYTIKPGEGFTMKGTGGTADTYNPGEATPNKSGNNQRYDFRGKPNDGNISIDVADDKQTLTGNPYPSAINLNLFLLENSGYTINYTTGAVSVQNPAAAVIDGTASFWEHVKPATTHVLTGYVGGYGVYVANNVNAFSPGTYNNATWNTYNNDGSLNTTGGGAGTERYKRMFSPVGQGFFVFGEGATTGTALMKNIYRAFVKEGVGNNSQFERNAGGASNSENWDEIPNVAGVDYTQFSKAEVPQIKIHTIVNNAFTKEVTVAFNPNTTDGYDLAMEAASTEAFANDVYFSLEGRTDKFIITTLPFGIEKRIPFSFKAGSTSTYKIAVGDIINFDGADHVYLYDGSTGLYHDIINDSFEITLPTGVYENRFEITFRNSTLNVDGNVKNTLVIHQNNANQNLIVSNPDLLELKSISLFDIAGKKVFEKNKLNSQTEYKLSTSGLADAVYIVDVKTNKGKFTQKIIISNSSK